jgi:hypothetical protein
MTLARACFVLLCGFFVVAGGLGQQPATKDAETPKGWKSITGADGTYRFLIPATARRSGTRSSTSKHSGLSVKSQINYCELADGMALLIAEQKLSGPLLKKLKISQTYQILMDFVKDDGYALDGPTEFLVGKEKGREYLCTKGKVVQRKVLLIIRDGRVFDLTVVAGNKGAVTNPTAETFLKSFALIAKAPTKTTPSK